MGKLDDLLDFTLDGDGDGDGDGEEEKGDRKIVLKSASDTAAFGHGTRGGSVPDPAAEEELEWLSNKDAFPSVETCFSILPVNPQLVSNHQNSPISVLENTNASSNNGSGSAVVVPTNTPLQPQRSRRGRKRKAHYDESSASSSSSVLPPVPTSDSGVMRRRCSHCQVDKTPQWRAGPNGPKTLCNACGVRYKSGRLLPEYRPANSPTFSRALHSNSHRKVVEMRNQKQAAPGGDF